MQDLTLVIPAKFESESLPIFLNEISDLLWISVGERKYTTLSCRDLSMKKIINAVIKRKEDKKKILDLTLLLSIVTLYWFN